MALIDIEFTDWGQFQIEAYARVKKPKYFRLPAGFHDSDLWFELDDKELKVFLFIVGFKTSEANGAAHFVLSDERVKQKCRAMDHHIRNCLDKLRNLGILKGSEAPKTELSEVSAQEPTGDARLVTGDSREST